MKNGNKIKRIAINTGGGDAPGLNAVIHSAVFAAHQAGWEIIGIEGGYDGILSPAQCVRGGLMRITPAQVREILPLGGTVLGSTNKMNPLKFPVKQADGSIKEIDRSDELVAAFSKHEIDALIAVGGDGSLGIARVLAEKGLQLVGVPKTIDNDVEGTTYTFGFDSAVSFAAECIDRLHFTAASHRRIMVVEVMGRYAGWIALHAGLAGRADAILIPEIPYNIDNVAWHLKNAMTNSHSYGMVVVAEGAYPSGGAITVKAGKEPGQAEQLGGVGDRVASELKALTGCDTRAVVLGHLLRGGSPTAFDRLLGLRFGAAAVQALQRGESGSMVAFNPPRIEHIPLAELSSAPRCVPLDGEGIETAKILGICFGE